ncbi:hypothetical protein Ddc_20422 [Ditylenchus destructor]|nr:hypothetical protein Ddc_20422 [Ditylenchus destructor]
MWAQLGEAGARVTGEDNWPWGADNWPTQGGQLANSGRTTGQLRADNWPTQGGQLAKGADNWPSEGGQLANSGRTTGQLRADNWPSEGEWGGGVPRLWRPPKAAATTSGPPHLGRRHIRLVAL